MQFTKLWKKIQTISIYYHLPTFLPPLSHKKESNYHNLVKVIHLSTPPQLDDDYLILHNFFFFYKIWNEVWFVLKPKNFYFSMGNQCESFKGKFLIDFYGKAKTRLNHPSFLAAPPRNSVLSWSSNYPLNYTLHSTSFRRNTTSFLSNISCATLTTFQQAKRK